MSILTLRDKSSLFEQRAIWRAEGKRVALVPTMGALHEGHLSLVHQAKQQADVVLATVFVNPRQFGPTEDFSRYPRDEEGDILKLHAAGAAGVYLPTVKEMYPEPFRTVVYVKALGDDLCGAHRPGFFDGVCTVVAKLLLQVLPEVAFFGEKDYQQLQVIRQMVRDLDIPVEVRAGMTVREPSGLALSSRNAYLTTEERAIAEQMNKVLHRAATSILEQRMDVAAACDWGMKQLLQMGFQKVDYFALRDAETLNPVLDVSRPARLLTAAFLGQTRLIDNIAVNP